ncbi:MAG: glycosyltransferase family 4 protein [SAR202 cluster bacterium]|nr:glycosyltransferase family 4 protein [SAR202 cluster bacterium]
MKNIFMFVNVDWFFFSHRLSIAKAAQKNNVKMIVYTDFTQPRKNNNNDGYDLYQSPIRRTSKSIFHVIFEFFKSYLIIKNGKPDLIHAVTIKPILILGLVARLTSTPFVGAVSGLGPAFQPNSWYRKLRLTLIVRVFRLIFDNRKARIICQSKNDRDVIVDHGITPSANVSLIPGSGVDVEVYSPIKKRADCEKYVLMSSRILSDKGVKEYCLAAQIVRAKLGDVVKFKLSGPIDTHSPRFISESELTKLTVSCGVEYLGNRQDMPELLASALIFVLPSYYAEGVPKVLLEASASGVAIVTTDHPGCRDAVVEGETGLLVATRDAESLAGAVMELLENRILSSQMGSKGRALAESAFRDSEVVDRHYRLYWQLCK